MTANCKSSNEKLDHRESKNRQTAKSPGNTISATTLSPWPRRTKAVMEVAASSVILGLLLAGIGCSKQSAKSALVGASSPASIPATQIAASATAAAPAPVAPARKTPKKRPVNVTYSDANSGVSFLYPRKALLTSGENPKLAAIGDVPMNFVKPGGVSVATVTLPGNAYPGTDFSSAFFKANVNRSVSEQECGHFAFVDTRNADGEPVDAEKVKVGSTGMTTTSSFSVTAMHQVETQYYHNFEDSACHEFVLGLGTEGLDSEGDVERVKRDEVFAKLEKILATVTIHPVEPEQGSESAAGSDPGGKE